MTFDIIPVNDTQLKSFSTIQMQLLRTAQKRKDELYHKLEGELSMFSRLLNTEGLHNSSLYGQKRDELTAEFEYQVEILREQLLYSLEMNEPFPDPDDASPDVGYIVDYTLSYIDRYAIVRAYYLAIEDPVERMNLYTNDEVAKRYLGSYYATLYNVLYTYSQ